MVGVWEGLNLGSIPNDHMPSQKDPKISIERRCSTILPLVAKFIQEIFLLENFLQETFANALKGHQSKCQVKAVTTLYLVQHNIKSDIELTRS